MLSILIPIYRFDVRPLVQALCAQAKQLPVAWEIRCLDDGSPEEMRRLNREMEGWPGVHYRELPENVGRSRIRNLLAEEARFPYLLFLDCDGMPADAHFLERYFEQVSDNRVVVGTRAYSEVPPAEPDRYFHWFYGRQREQRPAAERNLKPFDAFCTFHFLCPRELFLSIRLDESLRQYGHEDTRFGADLKVIGAEVRHIDNAYLHLDVEPTDVFLEKTKQGIQNLALLGHRMPDLGSRLLKMYWKVKPLAPLLLLAFAFLEKPLERQLHSSSPSLPLFDLYKLGWLVRCMQHPEDLPG